MKRNLLFVAALAAVMTLVAVPVMALDIPLTDATFHKSRLKRAVIRESAARRGTYELVFRYVDGSTETCLLDGTMNIRVEQDSSIQGTWARAYSHLTPAWCAVAVRTKAAKREWEETMEQFGFPRDVLPEYVSPVTPIR